MAIDTSPTTDMWSGIYESTQLQIRVSFSNGVPGMYIHRKCCGLASADHFSNFGDAPWGEYDLLPSHLEKSLTDEYRRYMVKEDV